VPWPLWVYCGPPEVYRGPCMKITRLKTPIIFTVVYEISRELLNRFAQNSQGRRAWSLDRKNLNVKVKGQRSRSPRTKNGVFGGYLAANISGIAQLICAKFTRKTYTGFPTSHQPRTSLKVKVNFGGLRVVYVWKNNFAVVFRCCHTARRMLVPTSHTQSYMLAGPLAR